MRGLLFMKKHFLPLLALAALATSTFAHCQIPCGIYGDDDRFTTLNEHITTIEKSMRKIVELSAAKEINYNQLVRWVTNKEHHANEIQEIVKQYFLAQRLKPPKEASEKGAYYRKLEQLHLLIVHAMKAKQTTDLKYVEALRRDLHEFGHLYSGKGH
jgi:nickel superoxide dismutase